MNLATRLDEAMKEAREYGPKGISQSELKRRSGVPQATISRTLKGLTDPETDTIRKLATALNVTFEWLNEGLPPKHRAEGRTQTESKAGNIKLASNQDDTLTSPESYAELVLLFGNADRGAQKEALRILARAAKSGKASKGGAI
jgi:transcriptional regulator with XRE-family HTH domain